MNSRLLTAVCLLGAALGLTACEATKSANILSPSVAGPIPGIEITAPKILEPQGGTKIAVDKQPVTLLVENASSNSPRPLSYLFEVATDANFNNKVYSRDGVTPGEGGRTSLKLPDPLATGRTYFWRTRAADGANASAYSSASDFNVFTPIVIDMPVPIEPAANATIAGLRPSFKVVNAPRSGPVGSITYMIELADSESFANKIATWTTSEQSSQTSFDPPADLAFSRVYYWRVRAFDPTTVGPWSPTLAFATPAAPPVVIVPPPTTPSGPVPGDAINLGSAAVYNSPADINSWAVTSKITSITMSPSTGLSFEFTTKNSWPDVTPPGWDGPLQYTVWAVVNIGGRWYTSGFIQMWRGRPSTGAPILSDFAANWAYDSRWGPMAGYRPRAGEAMGFFVAAGDNRNNKAVSSLKERSNVVIVNLPAGDSGYFPF